MNREYTCDWCKFYTPEVCTRFPVWTDVICSHRHYCGEHMWNQKAREEVKKEYRESIDE